MSFDDFLLSRIQPEPNRVGKTYIGDVEISTVEMQWPEELRFAHSFGYNFETMIFGGELDQDQERYSTREEAIKGHRLAVRRVRAAIRRQKAEKNK